MLINMILGYEFDVNFILFMLLHRVQMLFDFNKCMTI